MRDHDFTGFAGGLVRSFAFVAWSWTRDGWRAVGSSDSLADAERLAMERGGPRGCVLRMGEKPPTEERA